MKTFGKRSIGQRFFALATCLSAFLLADVVSAMDKVTFERDKKVVTVEGEVVYEGAKGGILFRTRDGKLWMLEADEVKSKESDDKPFKGMTNEEMKAELLGEFPEGFKVHRTTHYVICYNTSTEYAKWLGGLYERVYRAFTNYWTGHGFKLEEPRTPLVIALFKTEANYKSYAKKVLGVEPSGMIAYYNLLSNRVAMYDLTGLDQIRGVKGTGYKRLQAILNHPAAAGQVATIVHEATHQIAFNTGLQTRFADWPFWVSEGMAMYFESPNLRSSRGWSGIGRVNSLRLPMFGDFLLERPANSLETLISDNTRFRDPKQIGVAYAEAWALNYFLTKKKRKAYFEYFKMLSKKPPLAEDDPEKRLKEFKQYFGDLEQLDKEFLAYMKRQKLPRR